MIVAKYKFSRDRLDGFALESHRRAAAATATGAFDDEVVPLTIEKADGTTGRHTKNEGICYDATMKSMGSVKPSARRRDHFDSSAEGCRSEGLAARA
jgi:acetyl-CoA C-acetyltransferase